MKTLALVTALGAILTTGCATKEYVHEYVHGQMGPMKEEVKNVDNRVDRTAVALKNLTTSQAATNAELKDSLGNHDGRISKNEADIAQLSRTAREALDRATEAGRLAEGRLVYEEVMTDDILKFKSDSAALDQEAMAALDEFATRLKSEDKNVFIEIQGHTDSRGEEASNLRLGQARADVVRNYLNMKGGIPLHRMATISYGESAPVDSNLNRAGRSQNRRVVLVVLQ
ncbi:MAG: OmpA family protein [Thiobacillus sp.]|nr:OmpA family protein [Thiobacillus sp.]